MYYFSNNLYTEITVPGFFLYQNVIKIVRQGEGVRASREIRKQNLVYSHGFYGNEIDHDAGIHLHQPSFNHFLTPL